MGDIRRSISAASIASAGGSPGAVSATSGAASKNIATLARPVASETRVSTTRASAAPSARGLAAQAATIAE